MVIQHPKRFNEWLPASFDGVLAWDFLKPVLPGRITPMDIDAVIERRGHVLLFESKDEGVPIKQGQLLTLETLLRQGGGRNAIIFLAGKTPASIRGFDLWTLDGRYKRIWRRWPAGYRDVMMFVEQWIVHAEIPGSIPEGILRSMVELIGTQPLAPEKKPRRRYAQMES